MVFDSGRRGPPRRLRAGAGVLAAALGAAALLAGGPGTRSTATPTSAGPPTAGGPVQASAAGELAYHGVALRPGGSSALGHVRGVPVVLLPGDPLACLCAYELLAGRLVRRLAGRAPELPHAVREAVLVRKIVSAVGSVDVCHVRLLDGQAEPLGTIEAGGLGAALPADGFVVVPAPLEGHPPGARVAVHLY